MRLLREVKLLEEIQIDPVTSKLVYQRVEEAKQSNFIGTSSEEGEHHIRKVFLVIAIEVSTIEVKVAEDGWNTIIRIHETF